MRFTNKIILSLVCLFVCFSSLAFMVADDPVIVTITSIENVGNNLEVNATFKYLNDTPYTGSVALKSTAPPGFSPSTQDWEYIPSDGNKTFLILNRQLQDYDSITVYAEPWEQYNASWYGNDTWDSPLNNTTVNQSVDTDTNGSVVVNVNITNATDNSTVPVIVVTNSSDGGSTSDIVNISTDLTGSGSGQIVIPNLDNNTSYDIQTIVNGSVTGGTSTDIKSYTGYKSVKAPVHSKVKSNVNQAVPMQASGFPLMATIFSMFLILGGSLFRFRK
jgi:hypothetical protein